MEEQIILKENPSAARHGNIENLIQLSDFVSTLGKFRNNIEDSFLNAKKGDRMIGPLRLTEGQNYGSRTELEKLLNSEKVEVEEGEIFFEVQENLEDFFPVASISLTKIKSLEEEQPDGTLIANLEDELSYIYKRFEALEGGDINDIFAPISNDTIDSICNQKILNADEVEF